MLWKLKWNARARVGAVVNVADAYTYTARRASIADRLGSCSPTFAIPPRSIYYTRVLGSLSLSICTFQSRFYHHYIFIFISQRPQYSRIWISHTHQLYTAAAATEMSLFHSNFSYRPEWTRDWWDLFFNIFGFLMSHDERTYMRDQKAFFVSVQRYFTSFLHIKSAPWKKSKKKKAHPPKIYRECSKMCFSKLSHTHSVCSREIFSKCTHTHSSPRCHFPLFRKRAISTLCCDAAGAGWLYFLSQSVKWMRRIYTRYKKEQEDDDETVNTSFVARFFLNIKMANISSDYTSVLFFFFVKKGLCII